jgi:hypothetical protein
VSTSVLEKHPDADLGITVVWTDRWPMDGPVMARKSAAIIDPTDKRVRHFHESGRGLGKAVARTLGWESPDDDDNAAWDIYLFWPAGVRWDDQMPPPAIVVHQLANHRDEPAFRTGDGLVTALHEATAKIVAEYRS